MAVTTLASYAATSNLTISTSDFTSLIAGPITVTGLGNMASITCYALNLDPGTVEVQLVVDGTVVADSGASTNPFMYNEVLSIGSHTIDFRALDLGGSAVAKARGLTVLNVI